jgi:flagellar hook-length control protein FliK
MLRAAAQADEGAPAEKPPARGPATRTAEGDRPATTVEPAAAGPCDESLPGDGECLPLQAAPGQPLVQAPAGAADGQAGISSLTGLVPEPALSEEEPNTPAAPPLVRQASLPGEAGGADEGKLPAGRTGVQDRPAQGPGTGLVSSVWDRAGAAQAGAERVPEARVAEPASALARDAAAAAVAPQAAADPQATATVRPEPVAVGAARPIGAAPGPVSAAAPESGTVGTKVAADPRLEPQDARPQPTVPAREPAATPLPPVATPHPEKTADGLREQRLEALARAPEASGEGALRGPAAQEGDSGRQEGFGRPSGGMIENPFSNAETFASDDGAPPASRFELDMREARAQQNHESGTGKTAETHSAAREREVPAGPMRAGVFEQIVQRSAVQVNGGNGEIRIDLKPEHLGHVRMQILTENQQVSVRILAELPAVREMIENGLPQLKADLQQQGLQVDRLEVAVSDDPRQHPGRRARNAGEQRPGAAGRLAALDPAAVAGTGPTQYRGGRGGLATVDMFV